MKLVTYEENKLKNAYGIEYFNELGSTNHHGASFFPSFCRVEIGGSTFKHSHYETEIFLIKSGEAIAIVNDQELSLKINDQLIVHSFEEHTIKNTGKIPLEFYSVYSRVNSDNKNDVKNSLIISAPPTPNGRLHLGHLSGPYLSADILKRYKTLKGEKASHFTGTDDHQSYTYKLAENLGVQHTKVIEGFRDEIKEDLIKASIDIQKFSYPLKDQVYQNYIKEKFQELIDSNSVQRLDIDLPFDQDYHFEAYLEGECPECSNRLVGQCCEDCGYVGDANSFSKLGTKKFNSYVLNLVPFKEKLKNYHASLNLTGEVYRRVRKWRDNLRPFTLVNPGNNGVDGIHVWCEMALALLLQREQFGSDIDELTYCFGIDNSYYYLILLPAIVFALNESGKLPNRVIINDFYQLNGSKFSTSRKHALWVKDFSSNEFNYLRFYLALTRSEGERGNFNNTDYQRFKSDIDNKINKLISLSTGHIKQVNLKKVENQQFYQRAIDRLLHIENSMGRNFSLNRYAKEAYGMIDDFLIFSEIAEIEIEEIKSFTPLVKMAIYPLMPEVFDTSDFDKVWSLDLRKEQ